jgi:hypothetical protein
MVHISNWFLLLGKTAARRRQQHWFRKVEDG